MRFLFILVGLLLSFSSAASPVVVELFTSEGCSSCPPAEALLNQVDLKSRRDQRDVFVIAYHVYYWNYLGWTDRFSQKAFSKRQRKVAKRLNVGVYTPQMVVGGDDVFVGSNKSAMEKAIAQNAQEKSGSLEVKAIRRGDSIDVQASGKGERTYVLVMNDLRSEIKSGENKGRSLVHRGVAVALEKTSKSTLSFALPRESQNALSVVVYREKEGVIVQSGRGDVRLKK